MGYDGRIRADARQLPLADGCIQSVVTSPPYWSLRDYGHAGQIGLERTPEEYVAVMLEVFREVWRVLKNDGTLWLNLGDSYIGSGMTGGKNSLEGDGNRLERMFNGHRRDTVPGYKPKDLAGIPWRVAFALQEDGWYLRADVIWAKPNPMPESVTDRPTRAHEYLFLLAKNEKYFYDAEAIQEPFADERNGNPRGGGHYVREAYTGALERVGPQAGLARGSWNGDGEHTGRNKRSVWTVSTSPYPEAHYATFPPALIEPCILAGSRPGDFVLDPFAGSGTVGRVCEQYSRRWIGCDLGYQDLQEKRVQNVQKQLIGV